MFHTSRKNDVRILHHNKNAHKAIKQTIQIHAPASLFDFVVLETYANNGKIPFSR